MTICEVRNSSTYVTLHNTWSPYEEGPQDDEDDIEWILSNKRPSKKARSQEHITDTQRQTIDPSSHHNNNLPLHGYDPGQHSVPSMTLQGQLANCILHITKLESDFQSVQ